MFTLFTERFALEIHRLQAWSLSSFIVKSSNLFDLSSNCSFSFIPLISLAALLQLNVFPEGQ